MLCVCRDVFSAHPFGCPQYLKTEHSGCSKSHSRCLGCPISSWRILGAHLGLPKKLVAPCLFTSVAVLCITVLEVLLQKEYPHWTECQNVSYLSILFCHKKTKLLPASSYSPAHFKLLHHPGGFVVQHKKSCSNWERHVNPAFISVCDFILVLDPPQHFQNSKKSWKCTWVEQWIIDRE